MTSETARTKFGDWETVLVELDEGIAWVTLNRPEKRNCMNPRLNSEMIKILDALEVEDSAGSPPNSACCATRSSVGLPRRASRRPEGGSGDRGASGRRAAGTPGDRGNRPQSAEGKGAIVLDAVIEVH